MSKKSGFISNLNKSTKVTMASCIGFILLTGIILVFFILFPITPSEKVLASIGRENVVNSNNENQSQNVTEAASTEENTSEETDVSDTTTTKSVSTTTRTVNIRITSGSGFLWNGRIPTGVMPNTPTTVAPVPEEPTADPGITGTDTPQGTLPPETPGQGTDVPPATTVNPDPNGGTVTPPVDTPPETPVDPPIEPPVDTPAPPPVDTPANSGETAETPQA